MHICEYALLRIHIIVNIHYYVPDSSPSSTHNSELCHWHWTLSLQTDSDVISYLILLDFVTSQPYPSFHFKYKTVFSQKSK